MRLTGAIYVYKRMYLLACTYVSVYAYMYEFSYMCARMYQGLNDFQYHVELFFRYSIQYDRCVLNTGPPNWHLLRPLQCDRFVWRCCSSNRTGATADAFE